MPSTSPASRTSTAIMAGSGRPLAGSALVTMHAGLHSEAQSAVAPAPATGEVDDGRTVELAEGGRAGRGDVVLSTEDDRRLRYGIDHVRNGTAWAVEAVGDGGALRVRLAGGRAHVTLPAEYVGDHVALAYARTTNVVQSRTVGTSHTLVDPDAMARSGLYVGASRGEERNTMHVVTEQLIGLGEGETPPGRTVEEVLARVIDRDARERSAWTGSARKRSPACGRSRAASALASTGPTCRSSRVGSRWNARSVPSPTPGGTSPQPKTAPSSTAGSGAPERSTTRTRSTGPG